jgi:hypothetical protein
MGLQKVAQLAQSDHPADNEVEKDLKIGGKKRII